jgi:hypothetical protein
MRVTGFGMMAGPPESMTSLVPADAKEGKGRGASTWRFEAGGEKWLHCAYDHPGAIQNIEAHERRGDRVHVELQGDEAAGHYGDGSGLSVKRSPLPPYRQQKHFAIGSGLPSPGQWRSHHGSSF